LENRPLITLAFHSSVPGTEPELFERYTNWLIHSYIRMMMNLPGLSGSDFYKNVKKSLEYPVQGNINHWRNRKEWDSYNTTYEGNAMGEEQASWIKRDVLDYIWSPVYELIKSYRNVPSTTGLEDTRIENAPVISLEAFRLSPGDEDKYLQWFSEYGCNSFVPLFVHLPGVKGYDWYRDTGLRRREFNRENEYPKYLSILYFENIEAFGGFTESRELAAFLKAMRVVFPRGLNYKWYVQYQLVKSWRK